MNFSYLKRTGVATLTLLLVLCLQHQLAVAVDAAGPQTVSNAIEQVEFSQISGQTLIKVTTRNPLVRAPEPYTLYSPQPRLFFDFLDTENVSGMTQKQAALSVLQSLNIVQAGSRTRLVLNLNKSAQYSSRLDGKVLLISLSSSSGQAASSVQTSAKSSASSVAIGNETPEQTNSMQNVGFHADSADLATIRIDVSDPNPIVDVKRQGSSLVLLFPKVALPDRLARRLDVRDFGTPMMIATTSQTGQGSQLIITNRGDWDYSVTQMDTSIRVDVRRLIQDANSLSGSKELQGKTISFNFTQPIPVGQMMGIFQDITGLNFVMMPGVSGEIERLKMENTPVETAISVVSRMYGLSMRRYGDVVVVGKATDLAKYEKDDRDLQAARADSEPVESEAIKVRYRPAAEILAVLTGSPAPTGLVPVTANGTAPTTTGGSAPSVSSAAGRSLISSRGSISSDPVTNMIFVEEIKSQLNKIRERIIALDLPIRQVMIEARIVSVSSNFSKTLGAKLGFIRVRGNDTLTGTVTTSANGPSGISGGKVGAGGGIVASGGYNSAAGAKAADIVFSLFNPNQTRFLQLELSASESDGLSKSIASPKILTQDGRQASITDGQTLYFQLSGGTAGPTTVAVDASTKLDVTPQINSDGKIALKVDVNKGGVGTVTTSAGPSVAKQEVVTNVVVENGGTLMLGGVFSEVESNSTDRVPFLGDLPYVGFLFKQNNKTHTRSELLIFLTPRIVTEELTLQ